MPFFGKVVLTLVVTLAVLSIARYESHGQASTYANTEILFQSSHDGHFQIYKMNGDGTWFVSASSNGATMATQWGLSDDGTIPADFDGDEKTDIAVWHTTSCTLYFLQSSDNTFYAQAWGQPGDVPASTLVY